MEILSAATVLSMTDFNHSATSRDAPGRIAVELFRGKRVYERLDAGVTRTSDIDVARSVIRTGARKLYSAKNSTPFRLTAESWLDDCLYDRG